MIYRQLYFICFISFQNRISIKAYSLSHLAKFIFENNFPLANLQFSSLVFFSLSARIYNIQMKLRNSFSCRIFLMYSLSKSFSKSKKIRTKKNPDYNKFVFALQGPYILLQLQSRFLNLCLSRLAKSTNWIIFLAFSKFLFFHSLQK